jgi:hypothetical protein
LEYTNFKKLEWFSYSSPQAVTCSGTSPENSSGQDGNAFFILGKALKAGRQAGWSEDQVKQFHNEAASGNYDKLLQTCMKYFEVK